MMSKLVKKNRADDRWDLAADVVVLGYGYAGGVAAIAAHDKGASPVILEKADHPGGTSVLSGGGVVFADEVEPALQYLRRTNGGTAPEETLRASLVEKEVLLREVHHLVKNNLATIVGLIHLHQAGVDDAATAALLKDLEGRIRSMALLHESLYQSENLARLDFQGYLQDLVSHLSASFDSRGDIRVKVVAAGVDMDLGTALPCGLIVNELITNALKHAFPGGQPRPGEKDCQITVAVEGDGAFNYSAELVRA